MKYLVLESYRAKIVSAKNLRAWIDHTTGDVRIFRLCGLNEPIELYMHFFGNGYLLVDKYGNNEGV